MTYEKANEYALFMEDIKYMNVVVRQLDRYDDTSWYATHMPNDAWVERMISSMDNDIRHQRYFDAEMIEWSKKDAKTPPSGRSQKSHNLIASMNKKGKRCYY